MYDLELCARVAYFESVSGNYRLRANQRAACLDWPAVAYYAYVQMLQPT